MVLYTSQEVGSKRLESDGIIEVISGALAVVLQDTGMELKVDRRNKLKVTKGLNYLLAS
jgi:hypothetical protein